MISDFDFTLTRSVDAFGEPCLGSHAVLNHLLYSLHPECEDEVRSSFPRLKCQTEEELLRSYPVRRKGGIDHFPSLS